MCSCSSLSLLGAPMDKRTDFYALSDIHKTNALRSVQFMSAGTQHINMHCLHINRNMSECLYRICMEQNAMFFGNGANFCDGLDRSDFIIGRHDGNQDGIRSDGFFQFIRFYRSIFIHIQISHFKTFFL